MNIPTLPAPLGERPAKRRRPPTPALDRVRTALGRNEEPPYEDMIAAARELFDVKREIWTEALEQQAYQLNLERRIRRMIRYWDYWEERIAQALQDEEDELDAEVTVERRAELRRTRELRNKRLDMARKHRGIHTRLMLDIISLVSLAVLLSRVLTSR